jgi:hypothetical protein
MVDRLTRRSFLKVSGVAALGYGVRDFSKLNLGKMPGIPSFRMGRAVYSLRYYAEPTTKSEELGFYVRDAVVNVLEVRGGESESGSNHTWLRTEKGWLYSAYVQPVEEHLNEPILNIPAGGMLAEVTVPYTQAWYVRDTGWKRVYRLYYATTWWVNYVFRSDLGVVWYQVFDDRLRHNYLVRAEHLRAVTPEELMPISPGVPDKRIEVDLEKQWLIAYEGSRPVFVTRIATGYFPGDTPQGEYQIERKQPSRHMASEEVGKNQFDLPGVPWVCYISWTGVSIHGTYWHNNYGTPQSHGCINLPPQAAKWIYRWSEPYVPVNKDYIESDQGTRVVVF